MRNIDDLIADEEEEKSRNAPIERPADNSDLYPNVPGRTEVGEVERSSARSA